MGGNLFLRDGASFEAVNLPNAKITRDVHLQGSIYRGHVDLSNAVVGTELRLSWAQTHPVWEKDAGLTLRNTHVGALQAVMPWSDIPEAHNSWRLKSGDGDAGRPEYVPLPVDLANFNYDQLGGFGADVSHDLTRVDAARLTPA